MTTSGAHCSKIFKCGSASASAGTPGKSPVVFFCRFADWEPSEGLFFGAMLVLAWVEGQQQTLTWFVKT